MLLVGIYTSKHGMFEQIFKQFFLLSVLRAVVQGPKNLPSVISHTTGIFSRTSLRDSLPLRGERQRFVVPNYTVTACIVYYSKLHLLQKWWLATWID